GTENMPDMANTVTSALSPFPPLGSAEPSSACSCATQADVMSTRHAGMYFQSLSEDMIFSLWRLHTAMRMPALTCRTAAGWQNLSRSAVLLGRNYRATQIAAAIPRYDHRVLFAHSD